MSLIEPHRQLEDELRARDPDRWLSSRFVTDPGQRGRLVALYCLDGEWGRVAGAVTTPLAGEIRFAWWSEALDRFAAGSPADHPALAALGAQTAASLSPLLLAVIEARRRALDGGSADAAHLASMAAAARLLDLATPEAATCDAALAWSCARTERPTETLTALSAAKTSLRALPVAAFPAVAHVTLVRAYAAGRTPGPLEKRLRVAWAVLRGQI